ncbi:hypothetical protein [Muriicola soli]|uniref:Uncharacterized protein n=1 Tax=Muriicola soli TaxID=2507538 RepID=A0A411EAX1_9FLAO|nr:hypothetical protein [Muriicola soli]QBA64876.1 hypothetical protein EQY75_10240 [Muriicola soli]
MKIYFSVLFLFLGMTSFSQSVINNYKYVIVPKKFDDFRKENQYKTSTMVKFYLTKQGINTVYDDALPLELENNRCLALYADLDDQSNMFTTKVAIVFNDCKGEEQYRTAVGTTKIKQYDDAYREAIVGACTSLGNYQYKYSKPEDKSTVVLNFENDVKELPAPPVAPEPEPQESVEESEALLPQQDKEEVNLMPMPEEKTEAVTLEDAISGDEAAEDNLFLGTLYAQKTETGYQLVDTTPSIQFYLQESSLPNVFMAERKGQKGLLFLKDNIWIFEYYQGEDRIQEELQLKF